MSYYANGYFKAKSTKILKKQQLETLIAKSDEKFFELLRNYGFGFNDSIEHLYVKEIKALKKDLIDALDNLDELKIFFYPFDILNTKLIYKQVKENLSTEKFQLNIGNIDPFDIYQALKHDKYTNILEYEELFKEIKNTKKTEYQQINYLIDSLFVEEMKKIAKSSKPLSDYLTVKLDITNLLTIVRAKRLKLGKEFLEYAVFEGGSLTKNEYIKLYDYSLEELELKVNNLGYFSLKRSLVEYKKTLDLGTLESNFERNLNEILIDYSFQTQGLGYIMTYINLKLAELNNIKIIYYNRGISLDKLFILE